MLKNQSFLTIRVLKTKIMALVLLLQLPTAEISFGQTLTQTIRGNILDADNKQAMVGATIRIVGSDPIIGTTANANIFCLINSDTKSQR